MDLIGRLALFATEIEIVSVFPFVQVSIKSEIFKAKRLEKMSFIETLFIETLYLKRELVSMNNVYLYEKWN